MDAKDIRNLHEAYLEVYSHQEEVEIDEAVKGADLEMRKVASSERRSGDKRLPPSKGKEYATHAMQQAAYMDKKTKGKNIPGYAFPEEVDLYNIILSHLLDEGYAETQEAAEVIMVNMSEDWYHQILNEMPWQVVRNTEGKPKKKVGKPVKSGKYARDKAQELSDYSKTGDTYGHEYVP